MTDLKISSNTEDTSYLSNKDIKVQHPLEIILKCETYNDFLSLYQEKGPYKEIHKYNSGLESHHIVPKEIQKLNGILPGDEKFNDTCINLTPFEHFYAHYLLAKEGYPGGLMGLSMRLNGLTHFEQITLETLKDWALLRGGAASICNTRESVRKKMSESRRKLFEKMSPEERDSFRRKCKEVSSNEELRNRLSISAREFYKNQTDEEYKEWLENQRITHQTEQFRENCRQGQLKMHREMTDEQKKEFRERYVRVSDSEEAKEWLRKKKEAFQQMREEKISNSETPMSWNEFQKYYKSLGIPGYSKKKKKRS